MTKPQEIITPLRGALISLQHLSATCFGFTADNLDSSLQAHYNSFQKYRHQNKQERWFNFENAMLKKQQLIDNLFHQM